MTTEREKLLAALADLGVSRDYGTDPYLPGFKEAENLVDVAVNFTGRMQRLSPRAAGQWSAMQAGARHDGIDLQLVSGFRSIARQRELIEKKLASGQPIEDILQVNAAPGFSQHHTGMALDLTTAGVAPLTEAFEDTEAFTWLVDHAAEYDFYLPYPRGNPFGFHYEPWHWALRDLAFHPPGQDMI